MTGIETTADRRLATDVPVSASGIGRPGSDVACGAALAGLPGMTPVRLAKILDDVNPVRAWEELAHGRHPADEKRRFMNAARKIDPGVALVPTSASVRWPVMSSSRMPHTR